MASSASAQVHSTENVALFPIRTQQTLISHSNGSFSSGGVVPASTSSASLPASNVSVGYSNASVGDGLVTSTSSGEVATVNAETQMDEPMGDEDSDNSEDRQSTAPKGRRRSGRAATRPSLPTDSPQALANGATESSATAANPHPPHGRVLHSRTRRTASTSSGTAQGSGSTSTQHAFRYAYPLSTSNSHSISVGSTVTGSVSGIGLRSSRTAQAHAIIISGPAGIGKSSLVQMHQAQWRQKGLWGHAKMVKGEASPFTGLVSASSAVRRLMAFPNMAV